MTPTYFLIKFQLSVQVHLCLFDFKPLKHLYGTQNPAKTKQIRKIK